LPLAGVTISHRAVTSNDVVKVGVPVLVFAATLTAAGSAAAPIWYAKLTLVGVTVAVTVCPIPNEMVRHANPSNFFTTTLSVATIGT
jgi:hypothetical protein